MSGDVTNIRIGADGIAYKGALAAAAPTSSASTLSADWTDLGQIAEDGVTEGLNEDKSEIKNMSGLVVRTVKTSAEHTFKVKFLETNRDVLDLYYPAGSWATAGTGSKLSVDPMGTSRFSMVLDVIDGNDVARIYLPICEVSERGDITWKNDEAVAYEVTVTAYPDNDNVTAVKFFDTDWTAS